MTGFATVLSLCLAGCAAAPQPTQVSEPLHSTPLKFEPAPVAKQAGQGLDSLGVAVESQTFRQPSQRAPATTDSAYNPYGATFRYRK